MLSGWNTPTNNGVWNDWGKPVLLKKDNCMWLMAIGNSSYVYFSNDGVEWQIKTGASWTKRSNAGGAVMGGRIWLMGGKPTAAGTGLLNDVWSSEDGKNWQQVTQAAAWTPRCDFGCVAFGGKLWVMGGVDLAGNLLNDIWSSADGTNWEQVSANAPWSPRCAFTLIEFNNSMCLICGKTGTQSASNQIWMSNNGTTWNSLDTAGRFMSRYNPNACSISGKLYIAGGNGSDGEILRDMMVYTPPSGWSSLPAISSMPEQCGSVEYQNALWLVAGKASTGNVNKSVRYYFPTN
jgi:hypothetical protein